MRMGYIIHQSEIIISEFENICYITINYHPGKLVRFAGKLKIYLINMIEINMSIAQSMDKITRFKTGNLRYYHCQQGVRCYIKWYSNKDISASLVKLTRQFSAGNIKLE